MKVNNNKIEEFKQPRKSDDMDMVFLVGKHIQDFIGTKEADMFYNDPMIKTIVTLGTNAQRVIINRYFTNLLLRFRAKKDVQVNDILLMLIPDGYIEDWFKIFNKIIIPFLKSNNVFVIANSN